MIKRLLSDGVRYLIATGACIVLALGLFWGLTSAKGSEVKVGSAVEVCQRWLSGLHRLKLRYAVETYFWENGRLPADLNVLEQDGHLRPGEPRFPWGFPYVYETYEAGDEKGFMIFDPIR
ncbi:MAG: hypothetical protein HYY13_03055 [Nitrospirae bacterium]|nr:hypothetical protein [Nitrospirota bacterium]